MTKLYLELRWIIEFNPNQLQEKYINFWFVTNRYLTIDYKIFLPNEQQIYEFKLKQGRYYPKWQIPPLSNDSTVMQTEICMFTSPASEASYIGILKVNRSTFIQKHRNSLFLCCANVSPPSSDVFRSMKIAAFFGFCPLPFKFRYRFFSWTFQKMVYILPYIRYLGRWHPPDRSWDSVDLVKRDKIPLKYLLVVALYWIPC